MARQNSFASDTEAEMSDERRAEIEAVAAAIDASRPRTMAWRAWTLHLAEEAIAALDRVRDARRDDEDRCECKVRVAAPGERGERLSNGCPVHGAARSPQGEDHEAGDTERLVAALRLTTGHIEHDGLRAQIHALLAEFPAPKADEKQEGP